MMGTRPIEHRRQPHARLQHEGSEGLFRLESWRVERLAESQELVRKGMGGHVLAGARGPHVTAAVVLEVDPRSPAGVRSCPEVIEGVGVGGHAKLKRRWLAI